MSDLMQVFSWTRTGGETVPEEDLNFEVEIGFEEAISGTQKKLKLPSGKVLNVTIPAGVAPGQQIRLRGQGAPGAGKSPAGDALVTIRTKPHPFFRREGQDIHLDVGISLAEAIEGTKLTVPTLSGKVMITIPAGSNSGDTLRLGGKGIAAAPKKQLTAGNQYVHLLVKLPKDDTDLARLVKKWNRGRETRIDRGFPET